jgi:uracil-DNA glycosylase family 4
MSPIKLLAKKDGARCGLCPLLKEESVGASPVVAGRRLKLIIVGEAPGRSEQKLGRPFVGLSGKMVDRLLTANKLLRSETYLTNAAFCRGESDKDNERAAACCAPRLLKELSVLPADVPIATLGATSAKSVLGMKKILMIRGFVWRVPTIDPKELEAARRAPLKFSPGPHRREVELKSATLLGRAALSERVILPSIHPAFVLRSEVWHPIIRLDFKRIGRFVRGEINVKKLADTGKNIATTDTRLLRRLGSVVSLDIETAPIADWASPSAKRAAARAVENDRMPSALTHKLLCVGLSDRVTSICLWPWRPRMAKPLAKFLRTRKLVVGHNIMAYDAVVLAQHGVL